MEFTLDPSARSPMFRQLQDQIRYAISVGELRPGDALPSIRELEARLGINRNTVRRAYMELQMEGTLRVRAGREAVVAARSAQTLDLGPEAVREAGDALVSEMLQRAEALGLDGVQLAGGVERAARRQDSNYPRCAYLECSDRQAAYLAEHAEQHLGRRVLSINLHALQSGVAPMPASVRFVITPHWHASEASELVDETAQVVIPVGVQVTAGCAAHLRSLNDDAIGLVVRDASSLPGFRERLRSHVGRAHVEAALLEDREAVAAMLRRVDYVVCTSPCADTLRALAPKGVDVHELIFETVPADLNAAALRMFPPIGEDRANARLCTPSNRNTTT